MKDKTGASGLQSVISYKNESKKAGIETDRTSPMLLPDHVGKVVYLLRSKT